MILKCWQVDTDRAGQTVTVEGKEQRQEVTQDARGKDYKQNRKTGNANEEVESTRQEVTNMVYKLQISKNKRSHTRSLKLLL